MNRSSAAQGPPGTGKTRTILNLLSVIMHSANKSSIALLQASAAAAAASAAAAAADGGRVTGACLGLDACEGRVWAGGGGVRGPGVGFTVGAGACRGELQLTGVVCERQRPHPHVHLQRLPCPIGSNSQGLYTKFIHLLKMTTRDYISLHI